MVRALAIRVLTSIRVKSILQIQIMTIKQGSIDTSAYVRKVSCHALIKVYHMDSTQSETLIDILDKLLGDNATMVVGSAVGVFEELCPQRMDLIHRHFRNICYKLSEFDEWGQVLAINISFNIRK